MPVRVDVREGRPIELQDDRGRHELVAAEGPERLSGDWWKDPYRREYFRVCTSAGELLWLFREYRRSGELRWWLHGWWD
jgi:protein ImuB